MTDLILLGLLIASFVTIGRTWKLDPERQANRMIEDARLKLNGDKS